MKNLFGLSVMFFGLNLFAQDYLVNVNSVYEVDYMWSILNAISMILSSDTYIDLLRLVFLFGGLVSFYSWVVGSSSEGAKSFLKYNVIVTAFLVLVFSSASNVYVKTSTYPLYYDDNSTAPRMGTAISVPFVVGYAYSFFNAFGENMTELFTNALSINGNYSIKNGGYGSAIRDSLQIMNHNPADANFKYAGDIEAFFSDCVFIPFSAKEDDGINHIEQIFNTTDIKGLVSGWYASGEMVGGIPASAYGVTKNGQTFSCDAFWEKIVNSDMSAYTSNFSKVFKNADDRDLGLITKSYNLPKSNFDEIAIQSGMIYAIKNNQNLPMGIAYAHGKNNAEFNQKNFSQGYYMSQMLPKLQAFLRAFIYALFPLIFAISLLPSGINIIKNYGKSLIWIEMWGVSSAVLNFFLVKYGEGYISGDLTVNSSNFMISESANLAGMAGYLYALVPAISYGLMSGSFTALGSIASGLSQSVNLTSGAFASDANKLATKEAIFAQTGKEFSYAESLHYQQTQAGQKVGIETGVNTQNDFTKKTTYDAQTPFNVLSEKMNKAGGLDGVMNQEMKKSGLDFSGLMGSNSLLTDKTAFGSARADVRNKDASSLMEEKHGSNLTQNAFTKDNEALIKNMTRQNEIGNQSQRDSFSKMQSKQDFRTQERPNTYRNDLNGDGVVSDKEMAFESGLNATQARIAISDKFNNQQALKDEAISNKNSSNESIKESQNANSTKFGDVAGASGTGKYFSGITDNANMRKDATQLQTQTQNGVKPEDLGGLGASNNVKDLTHAKSESKTFSNVLPELMKKDSEMQANFQAKYGENADTVMFNAYGEKGIFKEDLTKSVINKEVSSIHHSSAEKLNSGLNSYLSSHTANDANSKGLMKAYSSLSQSYEKALETGDARRIEAIERVLGSEQMKPLRNLANDYMVSNEAKEIISNANSDINSVYGKYESIGVIKRDGANIGYLDTQKSLEKANDSERIMIAGRTKAGLDGLSVSTNSIDGRETKFTQSITGDNTTHISKAVQEFSNSGNYNNDILYHIGKSDIVDGSTLATGVSTVSTGLKVVGVGKFLLR